MAKLTVKSVKKPLKKDKDMKIKSKGKEESKKVSKVKVKKTKVKSDDYIAKCISKIRKNQSENEELLLELSKSNVQITVNMCEDTKSTALKVDMVMEDRKSFRIMYEFKKTVKY